MDVVSLRSSPQSPTRRVVVVVVVAAAVTDRAADNMKRVCLFAATITSVLSSLAVLAAGILSHRPRRRPSGENVSSATPATTTSTTASPTALPPSSKD